MGAGETMGGGAGSAAGASAVGGETRFTAVAQAQRRPSHARNAGAGNAAEEQRAAERAAQVAQVEARLGADGFFAQ